MEILVDAQVKEQSSVLQPIECKLLQVIG